MTVGRLSLGSAESSGGDAACLDRVGGDEDEVKHRLRVVDAEEVTTAQAPLRTPLP